MNAKELLIRIDERQEQFGKDMAALREEVKSGFVAQETRITTLEKYKDNLQGKVTVLTTLVSAGAVAAWELGKNLIAKRG